MNINIFDSDVFEIVHTLDASETERLLKSEYFQEFLNESGTQNTIIGNIVEGNLNIDINMLDLDYLYCISSMTEEKRKQMKWLIEIKREAWENYILMKDSVFCAGEGEYYVL